MHIAATIFPTAYAMAPARLGPALEDRGFESLWVAEHSHIPASRESPWPGGPELPQIYYDTLDPFVALSAMAATTSTLKLATGVALAIQRDPIHLAKEVASLDVISGGRFLLGVGAGWNLEEMADHGTDPERRFGRLRETVEAMTAIWSNDVAEYHGDQIDFGPMHQNPKPVQKPHPPVHLGGGFPGALRRAITYGDGWIPIGGRGNDALADQLRQVDHHLAEAGRSRDDFEISIFAAAPKRDALEELRALGVDRAVLVLPSDPEEDLLPRLDRYAGLID